MIHLQSESLRLDIVPEIGASIFGMDFKCGKDWQPVLLPDPAKPQDPPSAGLFCMLPFANRARGNLLHDRQLQPNTAEPLALHGTAWQRSWAVERSNAASVRLSLATALASDPYPFSAILDIKAAGNVLYLRIVLRNDAAESVPAGLGVHPFFARLPGTKLQFRASHFYLETPGHLPGDLITLPPELDFGSSASLPLTWRNNAYGGWDGLARILQPDLGYELVMIAGKGLRELMLYVDPALPRFALEPQSHTSGATVIETPASQVGLTTLAPGQTLYASLAFALFPLS